MTHQSASALHIEQPWAPVDAQKSPSRLPRCPARQRCCSSSQPPATPGRWCGQASPGGRSQKTSRPSRSSCGGGHQCLSPNGLVPASTSGSATIHSIVEDLKNPLWLMAPSAIWPRLKTSMPSPTTPRIPRIPIWFPGRPCCRWRRPPPALVPLPPLFFWPLIMSVLPLVLLHRDFPTR